MIEITNLRKSYGDDEVLRDINLTIHKGEIHGLIGSSGAGKSTLLSCMNGLEIYQKGSVKVDGQPIEDLSELQLRELRKNMGMIFQSFSLLSRKTVYQNIALPGECWKMDKAEIDQRVRSLADLVGLSDKLNAKPNELSGGQKQRVAIARALMLDPAYLLCDEATSALDPKTTISILNLLEDIRNKIGITIVVVTHEMHVVQRICDRMSIIDQGMLVETGKVSDIFMGNSQGLSKLLGEDTPSISGDCIYFKIYFGEEEQNDYLLWNIAQVINGKFFLEDTKTYYFQQKKHLSLTLKIENSDNTSLREYLDSRGTSYEVFREGDALC